MLTHTWVKTLFSLPLPVCQRLDLIRIIYCWFAHLLFYSECYWRFLVHHVLTAILFFSRPLRVKWEWAVNWTKLRVRCSTVKFLTFGASWLQRLSSLLETGWNISSNAWTSITIGWVLRSCVVGALLFFLNRKISLGLMRFNLFAFLCESYIFVIFH